MIRGLFNRVVALAAAVVMLASGAAPLLAAESPLALADALYANYLGKGEPADYGALASEELARLHAAEVKRIEAGEEPLFDFDPVIDAQDFQITDFNTELTPDSNEYAATVLVSFKNFGKPVSIELLTYKYGDDWRIDDVVSRNPENPYSLLDLLSPPIVFPAETFADPKSVAEALYSPYIDPNFEWRRWDQSQFLSSELNALYANDAKESEERQEVGRIDFDPFINGQDFDIKNLVVGAPALSGDTATVKVDFTNFDNPESVTLSLIKQDGRWKVDNAINTDPEYPYDLKAILSAPLPQ